MKREGQLGTDLSNILRRQRAVVFPQIMDARTVPGTPDKYVSHYIWRGWVELKVTGNGLSPLQIDMGKTLVGNGDEYCVVWFPKYCYSCTIDTALTVQPWYNVSDPALRAHARVISDTFTTRASALLQTLRHWYGSMRSLDSLAYSEDDVTNSTFCKAVLNGTLKVVT